MTRSAGSDGPALLARTIKILDESVVFTSRTGRRQLTELALLVYPIEMSVEEMVRCNKTAQAFVNAWTEPGGRKIAPMKELAEASGRRWRGSPTSLLHRVNRGTPIELVYDQVHHSNINELLERLLRGKVRWTASKALRGYVDRWSITIS